MREEFIPLLILRSFSLVKFCHCLFIVIDVIYLRFLLLVSCSEFDIGGDLVFFKQFNGLYIFERWERPEYSAYSGHGKRYSDRGFVHKTYVQITGKEKKIFSITGYLDECGLPLDETVDPYIFYNQCNLLIHSQIYQISIYNVQ